jgi:hypothetical protein
MSDLMYFVRRFGLLEGVKRHFEYDWWPWLNGGRVRYRYRRYTRSERRRKKGYYPTGKIAIDRDGDLYLVECPVCGTQTVSRETETVKDEDGGVRKRTLYFECHIGHRFQVYLEDGVREIADYRQGEAILPARVVFDPYADRWCLGIVTDAPWWWRRRDLYQDYHPETGKDGHGHRKYLVLPSIEQNQTVGCGVPMREMKAKCDTG